MIDSILDFFINLWEYLMDLFSEVNPNVLAVTAIIWLGILFMVWKFQHFQDYSTLYKIIFSVASGPLIFFVLQFKANR